MDLAPDVSLVIGNYIDVIRRDIVEDEKLIEVCNKIYAKHKRALDLIFEHRNDGRTQLADGIKATLTTLTEEGVICASPFTSSNTNFFVFRTNEMNHYLPPIDTPTSSWGNEYIYIRIGLPSAKISSAACLKSGDGMSRNSKCKPCRK